MNNLDFTEESLNNEIVQARASAAIADASEPRAQAAYYDLNTGRIVIELLNGATFLFPLKKTLRHSALTSAFLCVKKRARSYAQLYLATQLGSQS